jgi:hypothetical protein
MCEPLVKPVLGVGFTAVCISSSDISPDELVSKVIFNDEE